MALYRGVFCAETRVGGRQIRRSLRTSDREEAVQSFADFVRRPTGNNLGAIMAAYLVERETRPSIASMREAWKAATAFWSAYRPDQITRQLCREYAARRASQGVKPGTIIKELGTIRSAVNWADKRNGAVFEMPPAPPPRQRWITKEEAKALIDAATDLHVKLFIRLAIATAGRAQAILDLTWDRVDFERGLIALESDRRNGKRRATVPMPNTIRPLLMEAHKFRIGAHVVEYGGKPVQSVRRAFATAARAAGLSDVTPHTLRHSVASWMACDGVAMAIIAEYLGHSDPAITARVYAKLSPQFMATAKGSVEL
jgi:integrase